MNKLKHQMWPVKVFDTERFGRVLVQVCEGEDGEIALQVQTRAPVAEDGETGKPEMGLVQAGLSAPEGIDDLAGALVETALRNSVQDMDEGRLFALLDKLGIAELLDKAWDSWENSNVEGAAEAN